MPVVWQLTAPLQGDREPRKLSTSSMQRRKSASRQVQFKPTVAYDDGSSGPTERSATQTIIRKLAKMTKRHPRVKDESTRDVRAELGVLRIYADIWNLVTTYKCKPIGLGQGLPPLQKTLTAALVTGGVRQERRLEK